MSVQCDIKIKSPTYPINHELVIKHDADDTIYALKSKIKAHLLNETLLESAQKLIYAGHVLEDVKTLSELNVPRTATFHLVTAPEIQPSSTDSAASIAALTEVKATMSESTTTTTEPGPEPVVATDDAALGGTNASDTEQAEVEQPSVNLPQLIGPGAQCVPTNVQYNLYMIDGFPYLLRAPDRRSSRRHRSADAMAASPQGSSSTTARSSAFNPAPTAQLRQHHVDLPATAAIPVRTAEGQRALILSPEGVRVMAAQGVNVDRNTQREQRFLGVGSTQLRNLVRNGIPHSWLFLKLTFMVVLLGSNSSWNRLIVLNIAAFIIFFWQSGIFAAFWDNWRGQVRVEGAARGAAATSETNVNAATDAPVPPRSPNAAVLQDLGRAFFSSMLPGVSQPTTPAVPQEGFQPPQPQPQTESQNTQEEASTSNSIQQAQSAEMSNDTPSEQREQEPSAAATSDNNVVSIDEQPTSD